MLDTGDNAGQPGHLAGTSGASSLRGPSSPRTACVSWASSYSPLRMRGCCPLLESPLQAAYVLLLKLESGVGQNLQMSSQNFQMLFICNYCSCRLSSCDLCPVFNTPLWSPRGERAETKTRRLFQSSPGVGAADFIFAKPSQSSPR